MSRVNRQRYFIDFTISSLLRRKGKNIALIIVYTSVVFLLSSVMFFTHAIKREASIILKDAPEIIVQRMAAGRHDLIPVEYAGKIRQIRGVASVTPRLWGYYFDPSTGANYTLMAMPDSEKVADGSIIIGSGISRIRKAYEGDFITFKTYNGELLSLKIHGVIPSDSELVSADLIQITEHDFRKFFGIKEDTATDLVLKVRNKRELGVIAGKIVEALPDTRPIIRDEILRTYDSVFDWRGGIMVVIFMGSMIAFAIFAWDKASGLSAEEKREIGILKAIGWETTDILFMKFWEGMVISLSSFLGGVILAYVHVFFSSASLFESALKGWSVLYPQFRLMPVVDPFQIAVLFSLTVVPYTVATIVPSWRAAVTDPDKAMRAVS